MYVKYCCCILTSGCSGLVNESKTVSFELDSFYHINISQKEALMSI